MRALILIPLVALAACSSMCPKSATAPIPKTKVIDTGCQWVRTLTFAPADTPQTKQEIVAYELARQKNCPKP